MTMTPRTDHASCDLKLHCPVCGGGMERGQSLSCLSCARVWPEREGIPSFLGTDFYWGEISRAEMREILRAIHERGWERVVHQELPRRYPDRYRYIFHPIRADWCYLGDIPQREAALDLGAGWGGLSLRLSRLFRQVVAVEGVWERIQFASLLFAHEEAENVTAIHADIHALPFPPESFDLVVMNGVLEWAALGGDEPDPQQAQRNLLAKAWELLRPGGSLYIGIENRFALIFLLGGRDHERPRWMGVLPRPLAHWYGALRGVPQRHPLTHSPSGYRRLLEGAGFEDIRQYAAFPSYSYPRVLLPLARHALLAWAVRKSRDWRADTLGLVGRLAHRVVGHPAVAWLGRHRPESLAIWARRSRTHRGRVRGRPADSPAGQASPDRPSQGSLVDQVTDMIVAQWQELGLGLPRPRRGLAVQLSGNWEGGGRVTCFFFSGSRSEPVLLARISRTAHDTERIANEHEVLVRLRAMSDELAWHVPRPVALWECSNHLVAIQECVPGRASFRPGRWGAPGAAVAALLEMCAPFITRFAEETCHHAQGGREHPYLRSLLQQAEAVARGPSCSPKARSLLVGLAAMAEQVREAPIAIVAHHGDFNTFDILVSGKHFWVTDWEWATLEGLPFLDLVTLGIVAAERASLREQNAIPATVHALVDDGNGASERGYRRVREVVAAYCSALRLEDQLRPPLAAATLLHWFVKESNASYEGKRYTDAPDSNPWVMAARALLEAEG